MIRNWLKKILGIKEIRPSLKGDSKGSLNLFRKYDSIVLGYSKSFNNLTTEFWYKGERVQSQNQRLPQPFACEGEELTVHDIEGFLVVKEIF